MTITMTDTRVNTKTAKPLSVHPAATIMPEMNDEQIAALAHDIKENGLLQPIELLDGAVLDGRHRLQACDIAGVTPRFVDVTFTDDESPAAYVASRNIYRRHLTASQRAALAVQLEKQMKAEQQELKRKAQENLQFSHPEVSPTPIPSQRGKGRVRDKAAEAVNASVGYMEKVKTIGKISPLMEEAIVRGDLSITEAHDKLVIEALERNELNKLPLPAAERRKVVARLEKTNRLPDVEKRRRQRKQKNTTSSRQRKVTKETLSPQQKGARLRQFNKVSTSRTSVTIEVTFGNGDVAKEYCKALQDDPKVLQMSFVIH